MKKLHDLRGKARRRCLRFLAHVKSDWQPTFVSSRHHAVEFRDAERLHRAGLLTASATKWNWLGGSKPRELALFMDEDEARRRYRGIMPRKGR